jgi:hypothetical protein
LRREQIKLQVALITPLFHVKGPAAPETKTAAERARLLIEQAEALGEPPEEPGLLFSVLYVFWAANFVSFNGDALRELAAQFLALAEKQTAIGPASGWTSHYGCVVAALQATSPKDERTTIRRWRFTIPPSLVQWSRSPMTQGWQSYPIDR